MSELSKSTYYMPFPTGPVVDANRNMTLTFQRFMLAIFNRTGKEQGVDGLYDEQQVGVAINKADQAEADAQTAEAAAQTAQATASAAQGAASAAMAEATMAENDAQSALKAAEDVLIMSLLTSSAQVAKTAQSLDDAAIMAAQSQIWPSQMLQSSQV